MEYLQTKGRIFDIQRYSVHDGNGIRTIVFLKGCVLRCRWCCNPESQEYAIQTMLVQGKPKIVGKDVIVEEVMETVKKDMNYYRRSGGGITLSGGECLCQPEFSLSLLKASKACGIHTALESTGHGDYKIIEPLLSYLDQYLMDIKHMNEEKHKAFTGKSNVLMLENAKRIAESGKTELSIRVPIVPSFNDSAEEVREIARFADSLPGVVQIYLLPYHRLGQDKYEGLDRKYLMKDVLPPSMEHMEMLKQTIETEFKLKCQIGG